jgi:hypothetical protein
VEKRGGTVMALGGSPRSLALAVVLCLVLAAHVSGDDPEGRKLQRLGSYELMPTVESVARELHPGTQPYLLEKTLGWTGFTLKGGPEREGPAPLLYLQGSALGAFAAPRVVTGHSGTYRVPQALVGLAHMDAVTEACACGLAILEPALPGSGIRFGGLRALHVADDEGHAHLCGIVCGLEDRHGGIAEGEGDGIDEVLVELYVVDRRSAEDTPVVRKESHLVDISGSGPEVVEQVSSEPVEVDPKELPVHLEYSGIDEVRIVCNPDRPDRVLDLPPELERIQERLPDLKILRVLQEEDGVRFTGLLLTETKEGLTALVGAVKAEGVQVLELTYAGDSQIGLKYRAEAAEKK